MNPARKKLGRLAWSCVLTVASTAAGLLGVTAGGCAEADYGPLPAPPYSSPDAAYGPPRADAQPYFYPDAAYGPPGCTTDEDCNPAATSWYCDNGICSERHWQPDGGEDGGH